jgi:hypothetical protein
MAQSADLRDTEVTRTKAPTSLLIVVIGTYHRRKRLLRKTDVLLLDIHFFTRRILHQ